MQKIRREKVRRMILITPTWQAQSWYPMLLQVSVRDPILLPRKKNLLLGPSGDLHPLMMKGQLQLAAWIVSGLPWCQKDYQQKLRSLSQIADDQARYLLTNRPGESGLAGVIRGTMIPFDVTLM